MKKTLLTAGLIALVLGVSAAETNPTPQTVPVTGPLVQDFSTFNGTTTTYPAGVQGLRVQVPLAMSTLDNIKLVAGHEDRPLKADGGTAATTSSGHYDFNGKIGWRPSTAGSTRVDGGMIWALNTTNVPADKRVELKFDAMYMRNLWNGLTTGTDPAPNDIVWGLVVMYRIGTTSDYTLIDSEFMSNENLPNNTSGTGGVGNATHTYVLPQECSNVPVLQIRWLTISYSGTLGDAGDKPSFAVDNLTATSVEPLPIKLSSFTGKSTLDGVQLSWTTSSEKNNKHFELLRSTDGKVFNKIREVAGNGNSDVPLNYSFLDIGAVAGANYYKLNQVDNDGTSEEFGPVVVTVNEQPADLIVYASKADGQIKVDVYAKQNSETTLSIYDANGRVVASQNVSLEAGNNNKLSLNSKSAGAGFYIASLKVDGITLTKKFIFQ